MISRAGDFSGNWFSDTMRQGKSELALDELASIQWVLGRERNRTFIHFFNGKRFFVKRTRPRKVPIAPILVRAFLGFFKVGFLGPSLAYGGRYSLQHELSTFRRFTGQGVLVPRLIYEAEDFIVLAALEGENVDILMGCKQNSLGVWTAAASGILEMHQKQLCLSQGFARNIMMEKGQIVFIDFEENPLKTMDLHSAQARDWIYFLLSTLWRFDSYHQVLPCWQQHIDVESAKVQETLLLVAEKMDWLRFLPSQRKPWGRDIIQLQAIGLFLNEWKKAIV